MEVRLLTVRSRRGFAILNVALCLRAHACTACQAHRIVTTFPPSRQAHTCICVHISSPLSMDWKKKIETLEFVEDARRHGHDINKACVESPSLVS